MLTGILHLGMHVYIICMPVRIDVMRNIQKPTKTNSAVVWRFRQVLMEEVLGDRLIMLSEDKNDGMAQTLRGLWQRAWSRTWMQVHETF